MTAAAQKQQLAVEELGQEACRSQKTTTHYLRGSYVVLEAQVDLPWPKQTTTALIWVDRLPVPGERGQRGEGEWGAVSWNGPYSMLSISVQKK